MRSILAALLLIACGAAPSGGMPSQVAQMSGASQADETRQPQPTVMPTTSPVIEEVNMPAQTPTLTGDPADARLILAFFHAYNAGQLDAALALLDDEVMIGDCDFQANKPVLFRGKTRMVEWLRQRIADHDQFVIREIIGTVVHSDGFSGAGAEFVRRTSDTLRRLGYPNGITHNVGAKIVISEDTKFIANIALGPGQHSTSTCYSYFGMTP